MNVNIEKYTEKMDNLHMSRKCEADILMLAENRSFGEQHDAAGNKRISHIKGKSRIKEINYIRERSFVTEASRVKRRTAAALATATVLGVTLNVFGTQLKEKFTGIFSKNENVSSEVFGTNFHDSDGHVEISVEEVLSDMMSVRAIIHYKVLDSEGREWVESVLKASPAECVHIIPEVEDSILEKNLSFENNANYLSEFSDGSDIYLELDYFSSNTEESFDSVRLYYSMPSMPTGKLLTYFGEDYQLLDISQAVLMERYEIERYDEQKMTEDKNYIASWVKLSEFGLIVGGYSSDAALTYRYKDTYSSVLMKGMEIDSLQLVYQDGTVCDLLSENVSELGKRWIAQKNESWDETANNRLEKQLEQLKNNSNDEFEIINDGTDGEDIFYSICFYEPVDVEAVKGIIIDGKMYHFKEQR